MTNASADLKYSDCLLNASIHQYVSLGKPLAAERLGNKTKIRIGVLPFYFKDGEIKQQTDLEKSDYLQAANRISNLSNQNVKIEFVFFPSINSGTTQAEFKQLFNDRNTGWKDKNLNKSTWGFVKSNIAKTDEIYNFTNLDSIILEGNNQDKFVYFSEAMMFFRSNQGNIYENSSVDFFKSIPTRNGYIDNAILLDAHKGIDTITHEILHNFGLTDLYGSGSGPGPFSLMAGGSLTLLNYEKAVLGWFSTEKFSCHEYKNVVDDARADNRLTISGIKHDSITLLKLTNEKAYIFEIVIVGEKSQLFFYLLEQDRRPPLTVFYDPKYSYASVFDVSNSANIGSTYHGVDFDLLIFNTVGDDVELILIPKNLLTTNESVLILEKSQINKEYSIKLNQAAEKAAAEKASAEKAASQTPSVKKRITIICIKGKVIKKVVGTNPKCAIGYKSK